MDITTFGRGGSDTSAVAVAAALNAKNCYIFSDVDGIYTADPNKFKEAKKIAALSYNEMLNILDMKTCNCTIDDCKNCKDGYCELCK